MKIDLQNIKHTLSNMSKDNDCQVTNMWNVFKETITNSAVKHIPQKRTKVKHSRPWLNTEIRKYLRTLQKLYKQKKKTDDQNTKEKYKQLKHHTQKITRQSYWKYIQNIVTPKEEEPHSGMKKFWTYIKHKLWTT
jgi:Mn-dependent DtxR family transcriptional regulator